MVSAKLRDNNPHIADLNDTNRPTKLAEMFSELYDNEWTNAFAIMENRLSDRHIIGVLLDIIMVLLIAYCPQRENNIIVYYYYYYIK